jgi:integrase/recombinase XerC
LNDEECEKIVKATKNDEEFVMVNVMLALGLRRSELCNVKKSDFNFDHSFLKVIGKGNKERLLPIQNELHTMIVEYIKNHNDEYLFNPQGRSGKLTGESIRLRLISICKRAGIDPERIEEIHPHLCRHTAATNLLATGTSMNDAKDLMGHSSISTTLLYGHSTDEALKTAMKNQKFFGKKE